MKKVNKFGIWALALVALAGLFPQTAAASGSIRSITACDPETGYREYGPNDLIRIGETLAFKVRLLNYNTNCTSTGGLNNPWSFRLRPGADETFAKANLPKMGLWISGHKRYATYKSITLVNNYYTDIVFEYKVQSGDMALPVKFCNASGTGELANSADQIYLLENVGPLSYWELKDEATGTSCEFSFGAQNLVPSSTDNFEYPPAGWSAAGEVRDYDLSQAGIYVQTVDFDSADDPWRTVYENKTTTVEGALPTLFIPGGANEDSTVYLWTESTNVAYLANGGEKIYHALDHALQPKDYIVYAANIVHATNFTFKVRGARGAAGQTTTIYLSSTPTNIYNGAGTLINNFISRTIAVTNQSNPEIVFELIPDSIACDVAYGTPKALMKVTVDAFTNAIDVALNPTLGVAGPTLPAGMIGLSEDAGEGHALSFINTLHFPARESLDDEPIEQYYYIFGLGFATNDTYRTTSQTVVFSPTVTGDGGKYGTVAPVSLTVNEQSPVLGGAPASIIVTAKDPYDLSLTIADSYANLHDATGYEVYWSNVTPGGTPSSASWKRLGTANVVATRQDDNSYTLDLKLSYSSAGTFDTYIYVKGPDGLVSTRSDFFFRATVESAKRAILLTDHDGGAELDRQYNEDEAANPVKVEIALQSWRNETGGNLYAFLVPQDGTENYISNAKFLTTTENARSTIRIADGATNSTATAANSTFYVLDGDKDHGDLSFWVVLSTEQDWSAVTNGYSNIDDALSLANPKVVFVDQENVPVEALNVEPKFNTVSMSGGQALTQGDGTETQISDQGLLKTFTWSVADVTIDLQTLKSKWTIMLPSGALDPVVNGTGVLVGDPASTNLQYRFQQKGLYTMKVEIQDKDMNPQKWIPFTFKVNVGDAPQVVFSTADDDELANHSFNETAVMHGFDNYFKVGLSSAAADPLVIKVTRTPKATSDAGILNFADAEADQAVYVTIPAGTKGAYARVDFEELDGTKGSASASGGFVLTATVTNTMVNADGTPYNEVYGVNGTSVRVFVGNVPPTVEVYPEPGSKSSTNDYYYAAVSANEPLNIEWIATDVEADVNNNLTLRWTGLPSGYTYTAGSATSAEGNVQFAFDSSGTHTVTLTVVDKDKGSSETFTFVYKIASSKNVFITPLGPGRNGQSQTSTDYLGAIGLGKGRVCLEGGNNTSIRTFRQSWSYLIDDPSAIAWAFGYRVGDVDNGSLPQFDRPIDINGNNLGTPISTYYKYADTTIDSFFYAWIHNETDDQGGGTTGTAYANPQLGSNDYKSRVFNLPSEQEGDEDNPYFKPLILEAVFSREWRPADNVGDINADGIPDVYAVVKKWSGGYLYQQGEGGGGGGGEGEGSIGGGDLTDLDGLNTDEDYLPAPTSGGNALIPNVQENWATTGEKFSAYYEIRGFGEGLNYRDDPEYGSKNYNVRGAWISEPDFTPAETNAYLRYCATIVASNDAAVVALAEAACTAAGEDPTDPEALAPYLEAAYGQYVFSAEFLATVNWSPENRTDPTKDDTDEDGLPDGFEYYFWYRAMVGDDKGVQMVGSRFNPDNIAQGIDITPEEIAAAFNPTVKGIVAERRDTDGDGLTDLEELAIGSNPVNWDTDGDGMSDFYEVMWGLNPLKTLDEQGSDKNPDGDFMASWQSDETWAVITVPNKGIYAIDEAATILNGYVEGSKKNEGTLDTSAGDVTLQGIPVFWYGADGTTPVPKNRMGPLTNLVEFVAPADETVTVLRGKALRLIHDQVYNSFGFDPRTGWYSNNKGACSDRWVPAAGDGDVFVDGAAGRATNTVAFTSLDEYLLGKYRKETGLAGGEKLRDDLSDAYSSTRRTVATLLWTGCTAPNGPKGGITYGDLTETFGFEDIYGADTDGDGVPDGWELYVGANPNRSNDGSANWNKSDGNAFDSFSLVQEYAGTDSCNAYSNTPSIFGNHPGNNTGWYNKFFPTDPRNADTDGDGLGDSEEGQSWKGAFYAGRRGGDTEAFQTTFTFIYGPRTAEGVDHGMPEADDGSRCIRGGGLNPCTVDTDLDLLPDGWERQFAGIVFSPEGQPEGNSLSDDVVKLFRFSDGIDSATGGALATPTGYYITGGMDGTYGPGAGQPGDAMTAFNEKTGSRDPRTNTRRDCDWDHDGLENFQEYLVQTLRHLRYDDSETPLMGSQLIDGALRFVKCIPFQAFDGTAFYETCRKAGFQATSAWKYRELGYFARPPHEWDRIALNTAGNDDCKNYEDYEGTGYRILLPPHGLSYESTAFQEKRFENRNYVSTDPRRWDTDNDGLDDYWELFHGLNPLLGSAEQMGMGDVIAEQYGGLPNAWMNAWTGWPLLFPMQPAFDAMKYPWMIGTPECDADGDGIRNAEEGLFVNITTPSPKHTDPTPLWMTDKTSPTFASFTSQYYRMDPYMDEMNMGAADLYQYPWIWSSGDSAGASEGQMANYMFSFEENEGYDTDSDRRSDSNESVKMVENASDPLMFSDPDRRQALYLPGWHTSAQTGQDIGSAVVSRGGSDTLQKPLSLNYDLLRQFTVEAWVRPEKLGVEQVILERVANYGPSTLSNDTPVIRANFRLGITADDKFFAEFEGNTIDSNPQRLIGTLVSTNEWTHLACSFDGSTFAMYVNDEDQPVVKSENVSLIPANGIVIIRQEAGAATPVQSMGYSAAPCAFVIGARAVTGDAITLSENTGWEAFDDYYTGWIDEVRVWDGARTGAEIAADWQKRYSFADVKSLRQTVYQRWVAGATRNDVVGKVLPVELLQHYDFSTLPGAIDAGAVALEPLQFTENVLDNVRIDGADESALGAGGLNVGWWWMLPVHSDVYSDYHTVPWVQNTCAHLPFMDGSTPDSMYWCENFGGLTPASPSHAFPNSANPYSFYNYLADRAAHLKRLQRFAEGENSPYAAFENLYTFQLRSGFVGTSDLVPLGGAFAKRTTEMWDGLAADAWTQTEDDSDADGLPNWWEAFVAAGGNGNIEYVGDDGNPLPPEAITWSAMVWRNGVKMTLAQAYLHDLADGMIHDWDTDTVSVDRAYAAKIDDNKNGIPDWWEKLYAIFGEDAVADHDNDQLSNYAEYLIGECFTRVNGINRKAGYDAANDVFKTLDPTSMFSYRDEGQIVPDYFRRVGSLYLGEMFADHDFMEDWWERSVDNASYASRFSFDAFKDYDGDGWSNFAECRHALWKSLVTSDMNDRWLDNNLAHVACRPEPAIGMRVTYYGNQNIDNVPLVVRVSPDNAKVRDALFTVHPSSTRSQTGASYIGAYRKNAIIHGHLNPGNLGPGAGQFYRVPLASDKKYQWSYWYYYYGSDDAAPISYGGADPGYGIGTFEEYLSESAKYPWIELVDVSLEWKQFASTRPIGTDGIYGMIIYSAKSTTNGVTTVASGEIGTINYRTGEYELDMAKLAAAEGSTAELEASVFKVEYSYRMGLEWPQTVYLSRPDVSSELAPYTQQPATPNNYRTQPNSGYIHEGTNVVSAFFDLDGDGSWTAGEPYGVCRVNVGWWKTTTAIELTDTHPSMARFDLSAALGGTETSGGGSSESQSTASITDRSANGSLYPDAMPTNGVASSSPLTELRLRVVRTAVNGQRGATGFAPFGEVVLDRTFNANLRPLFTEADLVADGQLDLDWGGVWPAWRALLGNDGAPSFADVASATYRIVVGNGSTSTYDTNELLPVEFTNAFEPLDDQTKTKPLTPQGTIDSGRPTFTWRHDNTIGKSYPAFQLKVWKANGTTLVYDSGIRKAPPRNAQGVYSWTAPLYANMVTDKGQVFETMSDYKWAVSMLDAKFTDFRPDETKASFRLECSGVSGSISDYGTIALKVKYFGPGTVSTAVATRKNLIRVQAFDTPDFTGEPAGETYVADVADLDSTTSLSTINARIIGLAPGTYYVCAFIDTNGDGVRQDWESWGYANYVGTSETAVYNPKGLTIAGDSMNVPESVIYIEDADTDDDGFPDVYEWDQRGNLTTIGPATGDTFFTQVNPDLQSALSAYANLNLDTGKAMAVQSTPVFRMIRASSSPEGLNAMNALLSNTPEVEVESGIAVTIESFSLTDGVSVKVETATTVDGQGLLALRTEPVSFSLELRHKASLAEAGWTTVASVPFAVGANETITLSADDLAVLREKIAEMSDSGQSGFFKVVLSQ